MTDIIYYILGVYILQVEYTESIDIIYNIRHIGYVHISYVHISYVQRVRKRAVER